MEIACRRRILVLGVLCCMSLLAAGPGAPPAEAAGSGDGGPGYCVGDSFCDDFVCYVPEAPISQVACRCKLIDPSCGIGECVNGSAYCEGPFCPAPVCYAHTHPISQVMCNGGTLGADCKLKCGPVDPGDATACGGGGAGPAQ